LILWAKSRRIDFFFERLTLGPSFLFAFDAGGAFGTFFIEAFLRAVFFDCLVSFLSALALSFLFRFAMRSPMFPLI